MEQSFTEAQDVFFHRLFVLNDAHPPPASLDQLLQLSVEDDDAAVKATAETCQEINNTVHLCHHPNKRLLLHRLCYSFVYESENVEQTLQIANAKFLSKCPTCLLAYAAARDAVLGICADVFDEESVEALYSALQAFDLSRISPALESQEIASAAQEVEASACLVAELWSASPALTNILGSLKSELIVDVTVRLAQDNGTVLLPRILCSLFSLNAQIRDLALTCILKIKPGYADQVAGIMIKSLSQGMLARKDEILALTPPRAQVFFSALGVIFSCECFGPKAKTPDDLASILAHFGQTTSHLLMTYVSQEPVSRALRTSPDLGLSILQYLVNAICDPIIFCANQVEGVREPPPGYKCFRYALLILNIVASSLSGRVLTSDPESTTLAIGTFQTTYALCLAVLRSGTQQDDQSGLNDLCKLIQTLSSLSCVLPVPYVHLLPEWRKYLHLCPETLAVCSVSAQLPLSSFRLHMQTAILLAVHLECIKMGRGMRSETGSLTSDRGVRDAVVSAMIAAFTDTLDDRSPNATCIAGVQRRNAVFQAFRDITFSALAAFNDDFLLWQVALSAFMSVKARQQPPTAASAFKEPTGIGLVTQMAAENCPRLLIPVPLLLERMTLDDDETKKFVEVDGSIFAFVRENSKCFHSVHLLQALLPTFWLKSHHDEKVGELASDALLVNFTECALQPTYHIKLLAHLKEDLDTEPWLGVGAEFREICREQSRQLVAYEGLVDEATDLIHACAAFLFRHLCERLQLWAAYPDAERSKARLPIAECSLSCTPLSYRHISKLPRPTLTEQEKRLIGQAYQDGQIGTHAFSTALSQLNLLAFPLATSSWPADIKRELIHLLELLNGVGQFIVMPRSVHFPASLHPPTGAYRDPELLRVLGALTIASAKMKDERTCMFQGIDICFDQQMQSLQIIAMACPMTRQGDIGGAYIEALFVPAVFAKSSFWFLRGLLYNLDLLVDEAIAVGILNKQATEADNTFLSSLLSMERSIWSLMLQALQNGPITSTYCGGAFDDKATGLPPPPHDKYADIFNPYDAMQCFFSAGTKYLQHVHKHLDSTKVEGALPAFGEMTDLHLGFLKQASSWANDLQRWGRAGQWLVIRYLVAKQHVSQEKAEESWASISDLGSAIRDCSLGLALVFKTIKDKYNEHRVQLPREILTLAQGRLVTTPTSTLSKPGQARDTGKSAQDKSSDLEVVITEDESEPKGSSGHSSSTTSQRGHSSSGKSSDTNSITASRMNRLRGLTAHSGLTGHVAARAKPRESLVSKLLPGTKSKSKREERSLENVPAATVKQTFDVALEMMQQWNQSSGTTMNKIKPMQIKPAGGARVFDGKHDGPKSAILLDDKRNAPGVNKSDTPQLKKMTQEQKQEAISRAKLGVQLMLQQILEWDFAHLDKYELPELQKLPEKLPLTFDSADSFRDYFKPLVLEECRCAILQERIERKLEGCVVVISKAAVSSSWMLATARSGKRKRPNAEIQASDYTGTTPERAIINAPHQELEILPLRKHDLVMMVPISSILNTSNPYDGKSLADLNEPPREGYFVAVVEKTDASEEKFDPSDMTQCKLRFPRYAPAGGAQSSRLPASAVTLASAWLAFPIASLTTSVREFQSLFTACFSPVFDFILRPSKFGVRKNKKRNAQDQERDFTKRLESKKLPEQLVLPQLAATCNLNSSQSLAVKHALMADFGVALLQGPPGTGKTKTLLAIIAAIFTLNGARPAPEPTTYLGKKILICAPSNAAVDEIAARILKEGVPKPKPGGGTETIFPTCLRVGNPSRVTREEVRAISLEERLSTDNASCKEKKIETMKEDLAKISTRLDQIEEELRCHSLATEMSSDLVAPGGHATTKTNASAYADLQTERRTLLAQRKRIRDGFQDDVKASKAKTKDGHLRNTDLFFTTLSGSASDLLTAVEFEYVIVDEAAQAVELSGLIPLRHEVSRLVLIGDPQQLPATVLSASAKKFNYERSLFQRLQLCGVELVMLGTQYRMRPEISAFPSLHFYNGRLANDKSVIQRAPLCFHTEWKSLFGPLKFFDVPSQETRNALNQSLWNREEASFILQLLLMMLKYFVQKPNAPTDDGSKSRVLRLEDIAVVTPYKQQVMEMQKMLRSNKHIFEQASTQPLEVCTIDSFQGREKKIIIFSCVRSLSDGSGDWSESEPEMGDESRWGAREKKTNIGFVADIRRLNVAITRARDALWIVGNARTLQNHETWAALIKHAKAQPTAEDAVLSVSSPPVLDNLSELDQCIYMNVKKVSAQLRGLETSTRFGSLTGAEMSSFFGVLEQRYLRLREEIVARILANPRGIKRNALDSMLSPKLSVKKLECDNEPRKMVRRGPAHPPSRPPKISPPPTPSQGHAPNLCPPSRPRDSLPSSLKEIHPERPSSHIHRDIVNAVYPRPPAPEVGGQGSSAAEGRIYLEQRSSTSVPFQSTPQWPPPQQATSYTSYPQPPVTGYAASAGLYANASPSGAPAYTVPSRQAHGGYAGISSAQSQYGQSGAYPGEYTGHQYGSSAPPSQPTRPPTAPSNGYAPSAPVPPPQYGAAPYTPPQYQAPYAMYGQGKAVTAPMTYANPYGGGIQSFGTAQQYNFGPPAVNVFPSQSAAQHPWSQPPPNDWQSYRPPGPLSLSK